MTPPKVISNFNMESFLKLATIKTTERNIIGEYFQRCFNLELEKDISDT